MRTRADLIRASRDCLLRLMKASECLISSSDGFRAIGDCLKANIGD